jgi:hypothetical protein
VVLFGPKPVVRVANPMVKTIALINKKGRERISTCF